MIDISLNWLDRIIESINFEKLPNEYISNEHGDIDLLVKDLKQTIYKTNAIKVASGSAIIKPASFGYLPDSQLAPAITIADNRILKIKNIFFFTI